MKRLGDNGKDLKDKKKEQKKKGRPKKVTPASKVTPSNEFEVTPYREIILSDGHGFFIKTTCG